MILVLFWSNSVIIVKKAIEGINKIYRKGYRYKKAGIILYELNDSSLIRGLLDYDRPRSDSLMQSLDKINNKYGSSTIRIAAEGLDRSWQMRRKLTSPCYTTRFNDLINVKC